VDFKIYIAQIVIGVLGGIQLVLHGDGEILRLCLVAEGILGGVDIGAAVAERLQK